MTTESRSNPSGPKKRRSGMRPYEKLAISIPASTLSRAREEVRTRGVSSLSAYITEAVEDRLARRRFRDILDAVFAEEPMSEEEKRWADGVLDR